MAIENVFTERSGVFSRRLHRSSISSSSATGKDVDALKVRRQKPSFLSFHCSRTVVGVGVGMSRDCSTGMHDKSDCIWEFFNCFVLFRSHGRTVFQA